MKTNTKIKFDALKMMHYKVIKTFTLNAVTGALYDAFDDEDAVKNELIRMDNQHDQDINGVLSANDYNDISFKPAPGKRSVLSAQGIQDLKKLTKLDNQEIENTSAQ